MDVSGWFLDSWSNLLKAVVVGLTSYVTLLFLLRISGKRTLSKMNMFDWVVTLALGSIMSSAVITTDLPYARVVVAFSTLIAAQFVVTWLSVRYKPVDKLVKSPPAILYYKGTFIEKEMKRERVPKSEILSAIRKNGQGSPSDVAAVLLESNGELNVLKEFSEQEARTMKLAENWSSVSQAS